MSAQPSLCRVSQIHCTFIEPEPERLLQAISNDDRDRVNLLSKDVRSISPEYYQSLFTRSSIQPNGFIKAGRGMRHTCCAPFYNTIRRSIFAFSTRFGIGSLPTKFRRQSPERFMIAVLASGCKKSSHGSALFGVSGFQRASAGASPAVG